MRAGLVGNTGRLMVVAALSMVAVARDVPPVPSYDWLLPMVLTESGDPVFGTERHGYAMTYGLVLSAAVHAVDIPTAATARDWLIDDMLADGWGMAWTWDPYGDGSPTPSGTPFAITTAIAINGLLDQGVDPATAERIGDILVSWARDGWTDGYYWYSLAPQDAIDTPNVNAMLAGTTARFLADDGSQFLSAAQRELLAGRVQSSLDHLAATRTDDLTWPYSATQAVTNDLSHHVYILWGAELAREAAFRVAWTRPEAIESIDRFDVVYPRGISLTPDMAARTESEWQVSGAGAALAFSSLYQGDVARWSYETARAIRLAPLVPRFAAHALLGIALATE